ncbi:hypothetical protein HK101_000998 [Irineochytrium annulatum]|nr:hypothetical protein HK101_000998 [Irineochytrium annulatum]
MQLVVDIYHQIFQEFDPNRREDRYVLWQCLQVNRFFFELGAARLWSIVPLSSSTTGDRPGDRLLRYVFDGNLPVGTSSAAAPVAATFLTGWQHKVYFQAVRTLTCEMMVPPERILQWVRKLDWVDARNADEGWVAALQGWMSRRGSPHHLSVPIAGPAAALLDDAIKSVHLFVDEVALRNVAAYLGGINIGADVEAIGFHVHNVVDMDTLSSVLAGRGANLRRLDIAFGTPSRGYVAELLSTKLTRTVRGLCNLTHLSLVYGIPHGISEILKWLLEASHDSLLELKVHFFDSAPLNTAHAPPRLQSFEWACRLGSKLGLIGPELRSMALVTRMRVTLYSAKQLQSFMSGIFHSATMKELSLHLGGYLWACEELLLFNMRRLRKLELTSNGPTARLRVADSKQISEAGLLLVEELQLDLQRIKLFCTPKHEGLFQWTIGDLVLDSLRTPALMYVKLRLAYVAKNQENIKLNGPRAMWSLDELRRLRNVRKRSWRKLGEYLRVKRK